MQHPTKVVCDTLLCRIGFDYDKLIVIYYTVVRMLGYCNCNHIIMSYNHCNQYNVISYNNMICYYYYYKYCTYRSTMYIPAGGC